jgi:hypothetical protein
LCTSVSRIALSAREWKPRKYQNFGILLPKNGACYSLCLKGSDRLGNDWPDFSIVAFLFQISRDINDTDYADVKSLEIVTIKAGIHGDIKSQESKRIVGFHCITNGCLSWFIPRLKSNESIAIIQNWIIIHLRGTANYHEYTGKERLKIIRAYHPLLKMSG